MGEPNPSPDQTLYPKMPSGAYALGHGDRHRRLRRLQRVRRRVPVGEQHPGRRQGPGLAGPRDALDPRRPLLLRRPRRPRDAPPARDVHALRERAVRAGLPRRRDGAQRGGAQRAGLQPLHRHAVLLQQLPVQGAALQLLPLLRLHDRDPEDVAQPGGHRPEPRRHGEVHVLRAADQPRAVRRGAGGAADPRRRDRAGVRAGVPGARDRLRQHRRRQVGRSRAADGRSARTRCWPSSARGRARPTWPS